MLTYVPRWPLFVNLASAVICLGISSIYHLWNFHSKYCCDKLATLDYGGVAMLIMGTSYPAIYYPFACEPLFEMRNIFLVCVTACCFLGFLSLLNEKLAGKDCRGYRVAMFSSCGISALFPMFYVSFVNDQ